MSKAAVKHGVVCDTGFLIRLNQPQDPLHANARGYLKYLLANDHQLYVSTIALAEYAVRDRIENLPMRYFQVLPFNIVTPKKPASLPGSSFQNVIRSPRKSPSE